MSDIDTRAGEPDDPRVTRFLRDAYRAPETPGYWDGLESRIMTRVRQSVRVSGSVPAVAVEWWHVLSGWVAPGAWAAGIAALVAVGAMLQARAAERRVAYAAVLEATTVGTSAVGGASDEALRRPDRIARPPADDDDDRAARRPAAPRAAGRDAALRDLLSPR